MTSSETSDPSRSISTDRPVSGSAAPVSASQTAAIRWIESSGARSTVETVSPVTVQNVCGTVNSSANPYAPAVAVPCIDIRSRKDWT
jgi:hypothetical protein